MVNRGLDAALSALADASATPARVSVRTSLRRSPAIAAIAYFCAAELLANVAKHSGASYATIRVNDDRDSLPPSDNDNRRVIAAIKYLES